MELNDKKSFLLYSEYAETFNELSDEDAGKLIKAVFNYVQNGELTDELKGVLKIAFIPIKQNLDRDNEKWEQIRIKRSEAGRLGGISKSLNSKQKNEQNEEKDKQSKRKPSKSQQNLANLAVNDNVNVNVNVNDNVNVNVKNNNNNIYIPPEEKTLSAKASKHKYGEYKNVLLKDEELQKLKDNYDNWEELIKYLDEYIEMKGYKAKSHYLCIRKWVVDAVEKKKPKSGISDFQKLWKEAKDD